MRPGEISLAHGGVLFLDELAEFSSHALQMLRQPLEEGCVRIVRADGVYRFPASFQLVAASNPCPCGYLGDPDVACRCTPGAIERYRTRLGGPLADRIDIMVEVARPDPRAVLQGAEGLTSEVLAQSVVRGRAFRAWRAARDETRHATASSFDGVMRSFALDSDARALALDIAHREHLTARGITRLCRVARTVADMDEDLNVGTGHVLEASQIRGRRQL